MLRSIVCLFFVARCLTAQQLPENLVHPRNGTMGEGQTFPATGVPFAMTNWTPQTRAGETKCVAPYYYADRKIQGIRASHFLSGGCVPDYGSLTLMPGAGPLRTEATARASTFNHATERATPYVYSVSLPDAHAELSVTGTARAGILQVRYTADVADAWLVVENNARAGEGWVQVDAQAREVTAEVPVRREYAGSGKPAGFSGWFVAKVDRAVTGQGTYVGGVTNDHATRQDGDGAPARVIAVPKMMTSTGGASAAAAAASPAAPRPGFGTYLHFGAVHAGDILTIRVGTSFTSLEAARNNLESEIPAWDFARVEAAARAAWHTRLGSIEIDGNDKAKPIFYTSLYHAMLQPRTDSDVAGTYPRFADHGGVEHMVKGTTQYDDFSIWDIFRAQAPLMMILDPGLESQMLQSIVTKGEQGGFLPIFPAWNSYTSEMVGDHAAAMLADAWSKGIRGFDMESAYRLIRKNATQLPATREEYIDGKGRRGLESYLDHGYIPLEDHMTDAFHKDEQVSRTLEYAYDDAMIGRLAGTLGHAEDEARFRERGENWRKVFDPATGFVRGRHADGTWATPFDPAKHVSWITEGTPWQYTFFVPQNVPGLIDALGGKEQFTARLDEFFTRGYDDHGNEPGHHIAYLYAAAGHADKGQKVVRDILETQYKDAPDGLAGNDDAGQMSAWYVMSALGFYQVCPGVPVYTLAAPRFDLIRLHLPGGRTLRIEAPGAERGRRYARRITLNGRLLKTFTLTHAELMRGGVLRFQMTVSAESQLPPETRSTRKGRPAASLAQR